LVFTNAIRDLGAMIRLRRWTALAVAGLVGLAARRGVAQQEFVSPTVGVFRYHADTLWVLRDTTETRVIYRGDTVTRRIAIDGKFRSEMTLVVQGDSAIIAGFRDPGGERPVPAVAHVVPASAAFAERTLLASEVLLDQVRQQHARAGLKDPLDVPTWTDSMRTYQASPASRIVQHRDTLRVLSGCPAARVDTTVFQLFGADSVRRLTPPARTFGRPMAVTLVGQMRFALENERLAAGGAALAGRLPLSAQCGT
jgi:hypothetical protein